MPPPKQDTETGILTREIVATIIESLKPSINALLALHERKYLYVVVYQDHGPWEPLFSGAVGAQDGEMPEKYGLIANAKAELSRRTRMNSADALQAAAHTLQGGDVFYQGSVYLFGLIVAASGAPGPLDEAISSMIAANLRAYCQIIVAKQKETASVNDWTLRRQ